MSLNDVVSPVVAGTLSALSEDEFLILVKSLSLGFPPLELRAALARVANEEEVPLPSSLGRPRALKINAWSFVNDHGQYADTYGLSDSEAGHLKGLLRDDPDTGIKQITEKVTTALRVRGSNRPVHVSREGMPGAGKTDHRPAPGKQGGADLKAEILKNPSAYGMYKFEVEDTGRPGPLRFRVSLGAGLYSVFPSKSGAIDVARLCRVNGRDFEPIAGRVVFWRDGKAPLHGPDIPKQVEFDGRLKPGEEAPARPVEKASTVAQ
jgi:hypothetical protein